MTVRPSCRRCQFPSEVAELDAAKRATLAWVRSLLQPENLLTYFQPIVEVRTASVFGYECLLRARDQDQATIVEAGPILDACRHCNLLPFMDQRARIAAIRAIAPMLHAHPNAYFFINFLPSVIYDPRVCLRTTMNEAVSQSVPLSQIVFEVAESEEIADFGKLREVLRYYQEHGAQTAIDDVGTGFATMDYLTTLQPNYLKIARQWLLSAEKYSEERQRLRDAVGHAHAAGVQVIMEGIETVQQWALSRDLGADLAQGFLFGKPEPVTIIR